MPIKCEVVIYSYHGKTKEVVNQLVRRAKIRPENARYEWGGSFTWWRSEVWTEDPYRLKMIAMELEYQGKERIADIDIYIKGKKISRKGMKPDAI